MAYGLGIQAQEGFGGGIFRGRRAPADSVYDALNALVSDERELFERGGSAFLGTAADEALLGIWDGHTLYGPRTLAWGAVKLHALAAADASVLNMAATFGVPVPVARGLGVSDFVVFRSAAGSDGLVAYAGSRKGDYFTGTVTLTLGSAAVVGTGTAFLANVDAGSVLPYAQDGVPLTVKTVTDNTHLTLSAPFEGSTIVASSDFTPVHSFGPVPGKAISAIARAGYRLIVCTGARVYFSAPNDFLTFTADNFHELPGEAQTLGAEGIGGTCLLFTTAGVWAISNMDLDPFDAQGNVQHQVEQVNKSLILWGDAGIVGWAGGLLVPAVDDVYLMGLDGSAAPVSAAVRPMYRGYVKAGLKPGVATVYRGHYFLPILDASNVLVDELVCRLDLTDSRGAQRPAFTRWAGHAASISHAVRIGDTTRQPRLLAVQGTRVIETTGCFEVPGATAEADGSARTFEVVTSDLATGGGARGQLCKKLRIRYELAGASAAVAGSVARGTEGAAFTALTSPGDAGVSDGSKPATWRVNAKAPALRFKLRSTSANTKLILRGVEMHLRPGGKA